VATGTVNLNFGAFPGTNAATVDVTSQTGFVSTSAVEAWVFPKATTEHSVDEHIIEELAVSGTYQADGTIRIYGQATGIGSRSQNGHNLYGNFNVGWVWV
jgi:hypothetical protein